MQIHRVAKWSISLQLRYCSVIGRRPLSTKTTGASHHINSNNENEWNDAWETAWLPDDLSGKNSRAPWESDVNFGLLDNVDPDTKAFVEDMDANWDHRRTRRTKENRHTHQDKVVESQRDYRLQKQRIHASLWSKEIQSLQEAKLAHGDGDASDDIDKLLDSCSEIFDSSPSSLGEDAEVAKNRPDGWETMSNTDEAVTVWDMSQREEDILLQEFERRMAFCKFQIASFIKTHIFSRRRPIDGWKYMIEVIGPNARKGKGSVSRLPSLADPATQPFTEDRRPRTSGRAGSRKAR